MSEYAVDPLGRMQMGSRIARLRTLRKLTQKQLGTHLGCTSGNISHLEAGKTELTLMQLKKLASVFQVHPLELIAGLPAEACKLADEVASLKPERRLAALRLFRCAVDLADAVGMWQTRAAN